MASYDIAVLGGGPAGVMAARTAARRGRSVVLFEARDYLGGMAASHEVAGVMVDRGSHRLHPVVPEPVMQVISELLGRDLQPRVRRGRIALQGEWLKFPLEMTDLVKHLPPPFIAKVGADTLAGPFRRAEPANAEEAVRTRLGPTVAEEFYLPYFDKLYGVPMDELAVEIADRRIAARGVGDVVKKILGRNKQPFDYLYPRRGFGQITEVIADDARDAGADIRVGAPVSAVEVGDSSVRVVAGDDEVEVATVLSSLPVPLLGRIAGAPADLVEAASRLRHRAMVLLYLVVEQQQLTTFDAHYFPEPTTPVTRMNEPKNYRESSDDPADVTVLCAEIPCWRGDETWEASAEELAQLIVPTLEPLGFDFSRLVRAEVERESAVYPIYSGDYAADLAALEAWVEGQPRLATFGRQGLFVPDNTHHALLMGMDVAEAVQADGTLDRAHWNRVREQYRDHVVVD